MLTQILQEQKPVIFFDELPWLATKKSGFLEELEYLWNTKWSKINSSTIILCGSAAAWMLTKLIHAKGGLHNRLTCIIALEPFTLAETQAYLEQKKLFLDKTQILELYMCTGGVPFYLQSLPTNGSVVQLVDNVAFSSQGILFKEYKSLLDSLFDRAESHQTILNLLASRHYGLKRQELIAYSKLGNGGTFAKTLYELEASGFIRKLIPFGCSSRNAYYQCIDEYTLFYNKWIKPLVAKQGQLSISGYWLKEAFSPTYNSWAGYIFEMICLKHITQIINQLGISGIKVLPSTWRFLPKKNHKGKGAQIDLVLDRADKVINLCEVKYKREPLKIDSNFENELLTKQSIFAHETGTKRAIKNIVICSGGILEKQMNNFPSKAIDTVLDINSLF